MRDRLAALRAAQDDEDDDDNHEEGAVVIDMGNGVSDGFMIEFFQEVEVIRGDINRIEEYVDELKKRHSDILSSPQPKQEDKKEVDKIMKDVKHIAGNVRGKLKDIEKTIEEDKLDSNTKSPAGLRMKKTQHQTLHHLFVEVMTQYSNAQVDYRDKCKGRIQRQLEITGQSTTDEEIENMIESGNPAVFTSSIITETQQAKQALGEIEDRYDELMKLEKSIKELYDMFLDMATLVEQQGEMVNNIERNVTDAVEYVAEAQEATKKAVKYQSKARRKKIMIIIIVTIVVAVLILLLVLLLS
ncbi:syntaxin-1A-like [Glandiceps talaboti]